VLYWGPRQYQKELMNLLPAFFHPAGLNPKSNPCFIRFIQNGQNHSTGFDSNPLIGGVKIINSPITSINMEIPRNFNSPTGAIP